MSRDERDYRARIEALARTESEIAEEKANSLGRTARLLEGLLTQLAQLGAAFSEAPATSARREQLAVEYAEVRQRAETQRWYLVVQREAMGLREHGLVERFYPVPPPLRQG